jgi:MFS family permease
MAAEPGAPAMTIAYRRYALGLVTAVYTVNLIDRGLMSLLLQPIKEDLQLSDTQMGLVTGIAFGLFYAVLGVPIARLADRGNRVKITSLAIGLWGLTVMACLFVTNFPQLALARMAAAVGESGCKPPTYSLVGDYYPGPAERASALAIYTAGNATAPILSLAIGGWLNELVGWRMTFFLVGIIGLVLAAVTRLTLFEPRTQAAPAARAAPADQPSMRAVFWMMWRVRSLRHLTFALILLYTTSLGLKPWYAAFLIRSHGMGIAELGLWLGFIFAIGGIGGILFGGFLASRLFAGNEPLQMRISSLSSAATSLPFAGFLLVDSAFGALACLGPMVFVFSICLGPTYAVMQRLVPDNMRATMMALIMLLTNLIGFGVGPLVVGMLSDHLAPQLHTDSLRYAMLSLLFVMIWCGYHFWRVGDTIASDLALAEAC